jgi:GDP-D-mannose dehydratase
MEAILPSKESKVHGLIKGGSTFNVEWISHAYEESHDSCTKLLLNSGDFFDSGQVLVWLDTQN